MEQPLEHPITDWEQKDKSEANVERLQPSESRTDYPEEPPELAGTSISTKIHYSLRFTGWPNLSQLVTIAVASAVYTALSYFSLQLPSPALGVSALFVGIGFGIPFALWFGGWAFVIAYLGNFVGAGLLSHLPILVSLPFGLTDFIQLGVPMILYRVLAPRFGVSSIGKDVFTLRGFIFFLLVAVIPNNIIGGLFGNFVLTATGITPPDQFILNWATWSVSNIMVVLVLGSILLSQLGPVVERFGLTVRDLLR
jgi:hypothetical protein